MASQFDSTIVIEDTIQGARVSEDINGKNATRRFIVQYQHASGGASNRPQRPVLAIDTGQIPVPGAPHPAIPNCRVSTRTINALGLDKWEVLVDYTVKGQENALLGEIYAVELSSGTNTVQVSTDIDGSVLEAYEPWFDEWQRVQVEKQIPTIIITARRRLGFHPFQWALDYTGKVNSNLFFIAGIGVSQETAMCKSITATTNDGGLTWDVGIEFEIRPRLRFVSGLSNDPWDVEVRAVNNSTGHFLSIYPTGQPIDPASDSWYTAEIYEKANFAILVS
jgi:hypothetical protein